jgi:uncharacterized protein (DUF2252 family)
LSKAFRNYGRGRAKERLREKVAILRDADFGGSSG